MVSLDALRAGEEAGMAALYEPVPVLTPAPGPNQGQGQGLPTPNVSNNSKGAYITLGKEQDRSKLLMTRIKIHKDSFELNMRLAHLPDRQAEYKRQCGVKLAQHLLILLDDMREEEKAIAATLEDGIISAWNLNLLYQHRRTILWIDDTIDKVCKMIMMFKQELPPEFAAVARAAGLP
ncbi:hypothetical protein BGW39_011825 [Mortierella sp. 14UC]|nr:hypothetical protein BGW39_011825 [Mortierella sp. 14UC]